MTQRDLSDFGAPEPEEPEPDEPDEEPEEKEDEGPEQAGLLDDEEFEEAEPKREHDEDTGKSGSKGIQKPLNPDGAGSSNVGINVMARAMQTAAPDAEPQNDLSCPWCFCPPERFNVREEDGERTVGCGYCDARIPHDSEWYLNGEKIALQT